MNKQSQGRKTLFWHTVYIVHPGGEGMAIERLGHWSHCVCLQEAGKDER